MTTLGVSKRHLKRLVGRERTILLQRLRNSIGDIDNLPLHSSSSISNQFNVEPIRDIDNIPLLSSSSGSNECNDDLVVENAQIDLNNIIELSSTATLKEKLRNWYIKHNISREAFQSILRILKSEGMNVPLSSKTFFECNEKIVIRTVSPGEYWHFSIKKQLEKISSVLVKYDEIILDIGIDGLPLYKSSPQSLWPILGRLTNIKNIRVMLIGIYLGKKKPHFVDQYLHDFVSEVKELLRHGFLVFDKTLTFKIRAFICDAPARAFVCGTVSHNSLIGCSKCCQVGRTINHVVVYSTTIGNRRSNEEFFERSQVSYHKPYFQTNKSSLEELGIGMVSQFPLDPMHLIDLGVTRKILLSLLNNKASEKLNAQNKIELSTRLMSLAAFIPKEFARKPRTLDEILRWKATEFRQFILYTGIIVLKEIVNDDLYYHFLLLHSAYRLLLCPRSYRSNIGVSDELLKSFVENFPILYTETGVTYNVHNLLHVTDCVQEIGFLNDFSAYPFENFMQELKKKLKNLQKFCNNYLTNF